MSISCSVSEILSVTAQKFKEVTWPWTHPFGGIYHACSCILVSIFQQAKFDIPSFTNSRDIWPSPQNLKKLVNPDHAPLRVVCHPLDRTTIKLTTKVEVFMLSAPNIKIQNLHYLIWRPQWGDASQISPEVFGVTKLESLGYCAAMFAWSYV